MVVRQCPSHHIKLSCDVNLRFGGLKSDSGRNNGPQLWLLPPDLEVEFEESSLSLLNSRFVGTLADKSPCIFLFRFLPSDSNMLFLNHNELRTCEMNLDSIN
jgi:hypothetical protein